MRKLLVFSLILAGFAASGLVARSYVVVPDVPAQELPSPPPAQTYPSVRADPLRLVIPKLDVDAEVQNVGINAKGNMATPSNFTDVAWYRHGPSPGERGSAVIAGHVDNGLGLSGVFKNLHELAVGDEVEVRYEDGSSERFIVNSVQSYRYDQVPTAELFATDGPARLSLITCGGDWLKDKRTYTERLVVTATLSS